ncbi:hypothetical protein PAXINDRAFT_85890, partial [Paxillus involutus ATCC 200175]
QDRHAHLINLLDFAERHETVVVDFAVELFEFLGYASRERTRVDLPLFICGEIRHVKTDVCIVDLSQNDTLLLVQKDKKLKPLNARAQLVAEAVAAFNENNAHREAAGLPPMAEKVSHARHHHGRHVACVLQNSHHSDSVNSYSPWDLSSRGNPCDLLLSARSSS